MEKTNGGQGKAVGDLRNDWRCRAKCRRGNTITSITVNDDRCNEIKGDVNTLKEAKGLSEIARILQLSHQAEKCGMAAESEDDIAHS